MEEDFIGVISVMLIVAFAQADVVYLKDGSVIKGKVIEAVPGVSYKLKTADGNIFVFEIDKVEKINYEGEGEIRPEKGKSVDTVHLKDGRVIKGNIIETAPGKSHKIRTTDGSIFVLQMEKIEKVEFGKEEVEGVKPAESTEAEPSVKVKTSIGGGVDLFKVEDVKGWGKGVAGDLRFMGERLATQFEVGSKEHKGDNKESSVIKETYKCFSWGATVLLSRKVSPNALFYGGVGASLYNWDYSSEGVAAAGVSIYYPYNIIYLKDLRFKEEDWGWHLCGGIEYAIGENLFLCGEIRRIMGTVEEPNYTGDGIEVDKYGNIVDVEELSITGKDWDYSHTNLKVGLRLSF